MSEQQQHDRDGRSERKEADTNPSGDEEVHHRQRIRETGEPDRDRLGNEDGAS